MILSKFRTYVQLAIALLSNSYLGFISTKSVNISALKGVCVPFLNCYACPSALFSCPIGTIQHFMTIRTFPFYLFSYIVLIGMFTGRMACGWLCPFGFLQDMMYKIKSPKYQVPWALRYFKYLILLVLVIILPYLTAECWFSMFCPAGTLTAGIPWTLWNPQNPQTGQAVMPNGPGLMFYISLMILLGFLVWFVVTSRPFCKVACPMGAILAFFNRYSVLQLKVDPQCDGCTTCQQVCPMDLDIITESNSGECIRCLECTRCEHVKLKSMISFPRKASGS